MEDTEEKSININMKEENNDGKLELSLRINEPGFIVSPKSFAEIPIKEPEL